MAYKQFFHVFFPSTAHKNTPQLDTTNMGFLCLNAKPSFPRPPKDHKGSIFQTIFITQMNLMEDWDNWCKFCGRTLCIAPCILWKLMPQMLLLKWRNSVTYPLAFPTEGSALPVCICVVGIKVQLPLEAFPESKCNSLLLPLDLILSQSLSQLVWEGNAKE